MKYKHIIHAAATAVVTTLLFTPIATSVLSPDAEATDISITRNVPITEKGVLRYTPTHEQEIWISVLEWCESRGKGSAINPEDLDGTPSYYWFQFKPGTFKGFAERYELISTSTTYIQVAELMKDYELTREIVNRMVGERDSITWENQFPGCVAKYGRPPVK
jgi:hypothetical protein